ncbi:MULTISPECIES: regulatory protein YcgZ [Erwinia]|uniref:Two-component-system connector protein YcgZ n=2 Tax=Erwinia TaxID=551 RepID=A0A014N8U6_9GAMM|nr:regulatory protein YcgZ [Erwinia mallotivora]EXU75798.1 hypothetical protein BG55_09250 [Erwinia mallotivora]
MRQTTSIPSSASDIAAYFSKVSLPSQQETLGSIVVEILRAGQNLNRKAICCKLLKRFELASGPEEERHYHELFNLLFRK